MASHSPSLVDALRNPDLYDHPVGNLELIETHSSWVLLTGPVAYKIRKPVDLGFLDFSTLELRKHFSEEELRLNRRLAPQLYLDVIAITGSPDQPRLGGEGPVIEYAVRMRQFDTTLELDRLIEQDRLDSDLLSELAATLAVFHDSAAVADSASAWGDADRVLEPVIENFEQIAELPVTSEDARRLAELRRWSEHDHRDLIPALRQRKQEGHIRECHGDLHLGNITLIDGRAVPFDCLEFNPSLRWIDTINEVAFLLMDLDYHRRADLAVRFLNDYLQESGDYRGLRCLRYYLVYRAMVRAKVSCIRARQSIGDDERSAQLESFRRHYALAESYTGNLRPALIITHGLSGCGKTTLGLELLAPCRALMIRSDIERKRLHGLAADARSGSPPGGGLYDRAAGERTYQRLAELGAGIVEAGYSALIDATFLKRDQRSRFRQLARRLEVPFIILELEAPENELRERVARRAAERRDASEAGVEVLEHQLQEREPLEADEQDGRITVDASGHFDADRIADRIRRIQGL